MFGGDARNVAASFQLCRLNRQSWKLAATFWSTGQQVREGKRKESGIFFA